MKRLKKLAALALSAVMVVGMTLPVGAAKLADVDMTPDGASNEQTGFEGSITITQTKTGVDYTAYQVFALTYQVGENGRENTYQYIVEKDTIWHEFVTTGAGKNYVTVGNMLYNIDYSFRGDAVQGYAIKWKDYDDVEKHLGADEMDAANFAKLALEYYEAHKNDTDKPDNYLGRSRSATVSSDGSDMRGDEVVLSMSRDLSISGRPSSPTDSAGGSSVTISGLPLGYYLVDSTVGSLCALTTAAPNVTFEEKNQESVISKQIWMTETAPDVNAYMSDTNWGKILEAPVGADLYYRITITPGKGSENLVVRDRMGRITMDYTTVKVYLVNGVDSQELTAGADYRLYRNDGYTWYSDDYSDPMATSAQMAQDTRIEHAGLNGGGRRDEIARDMGVKLGHVDQVLDEYYNFGLIFKNRDWTGSEKLVITYKAKQDDNAYLVSGYDAAGYSINAGGIVTPNVTQANVAKLGAADMPGGDFDTLISNTMDTELPSFKEDKWTSSEADVNNYGFDIAKTDGDNRLLKGATFELRTNPDDPSTAVKLVKLEGKQGGSRNESIFPQDGTAYSFAPAGASNVTTEIEAGYATVVGLSTGTYYIVEINAPEGYNRLSAPQQVKVFSIRDSYKGSVGTSDGEIRGLNQAFRNLSPIQVNGKGYDLSAYGWDENCTTAYAMWTLNTDPETGKKYYTYGNERQILQIGANAGDKLGGDFLVEGGVHLINLTGAELPHTGGIGTTIFYAVGGLLVVGAGVLLVVKKRMTIED